MKTNSLFVRFSLCTMLLLAVMPTMATKLKIVNMAPNQKILIGNRYCAKDSIFDANDIIYWDRNLENQAFKVVCIEDCKAIKMSGPKEVSRNCTKREAQRKSGINVSFATLIMATKGDTNEGPIVLWPGELILVEGVDARQGFDYYCRVKGNLPKLPIVVKENKLYLNSDDFKDFGTEIRIEIFQVNKSDMMDIQIIKEFTVEQVK